MNIFVLDYDPLDAARFHCDKHVVKMHVEGIQMLVSVLDRYDVQHSVVTKSGRIHRGGYAYHPCTRWAGDSFANTIWLRSYTAALIFQHRLRYGKLPFSDEQLMRFDDSLNDLHKKLPDKDLTPFAQAMPDQYKHSCAVVAYRRYYKHEKTFATYAKGIDSPTWL